MHDRISVIHLGRRYPYHLSARYEAKRVHRGVKSQGSSSLRAVWNREM
ncbi:hypothetical protein EDWATA_02045 [Edwardsiella tarda ATCC 23685]|uniref:Uncharacterized protein n=1 Tax=Edwardsiella tarda ATCC 23685 TaxID=500638 RepID=D4F5L7_EDWTA|nr:hypothetical protein EDWATA_02045 [Edwardsiella tarda ATCC 23685]